MLKYSSKYVRLPRGESPVRRELIQRENLDISKKGESGKRKKATRRSDDY